MFDNNIIDSIEFLAISNFTTPDVGREETVASTC
jgi:hypothetical protein